MDCPEPLPIGDFVLGVLLLGGILISYLPQIVKIWMRKSHVGLSITRLVLATVFSSTNLLLYVTLESNHTFYCCTSGFMCFSNLVSFIQTILIVLSDEATVLLAFFYFDVDWLVANGEDALKLFDSAKKVVAGLLIYQAIVLIVFMGFTLDLGFDHDATFYFGQILVIISSVGTMIVLLPQIYSTYKLKHIGSLSMETLFMQGFGTFLLAYFSLSQNSWYITMPYFVSATFTTILFFEALYYVRQDKKTGHDPTATANHRQTEKHEHESINAE